MSEGPEVADARPATRHSRRVQQALRTADKGEAYHWPTIAATLAREVRRLAALDGRAAATAPGTGGPAGDAQMRLALVEVRGLHFPLLDRGVCVRCTSDSWPCTTSVLLDRALSAAAGSVPEDGGRGVLLDGKAAILREWGKIVSGRERWTDEMLAAAAMLALRMDGLLADEAAAAPVEAAEEPLPPSCETCRDAPSYCPECGGGQTPGAIPPAAPVGGRSQDEQERRATGLWAAHDGWVCAEANTCTCGGSGLDYGPFHMPGCGLEPLADVGENAAALVAEHNAALSAAATPPAWCERCSRWTTRGQAYVLIGPGRFTHRGPCTVVTSEGRKAADAPPAQATPQHINEILRHRWP